MERSELREVPVIHVDSGKTAVDCVNYGLIIEESDLRVRPAVKLVMPACLKMCEVESLLPMAGSPRREWIAPLKKTSMKQE